MSLIKQFTITVLFIIFGTSCSSLEKSYENTLETFENLASIAEETYRPPLGLDDNINIEFARHQFNRRKFSITEHYLKKTLAHQPDHPEALQLLPWTYFFQKCYDKALQAFKKAHSIDKKNPTPLIGMGWSYYSLKLYQKSLDSFERAERFAPNSYEVHKGKAFLHLEQRRSQQAQDELTKIFRLAEVDESLELWKSWSKNNNSIHWEIIPSTPESIAVFALPVEFPRYRSLLLGLPSADTESLDLAWKKFHQGKYEIAADLFDNISNPPNLDAVNGLAWSLLRAKQINKSEKIFKEIIESYPRFPGALKGLQEVLTIKKSQAVYVQYYMDLGKYQLAEDKLDELVARYGDWAHLYNQYGKISIARKDFEKARKRFLSALKYSPQDSTAKLGLEQVQMAMDKQLYKADQAFKKGDYKTATIMYHDYLGEEQWPSAKFTLAHAYNGLGWSQFNKKQYEYAIDKFSKSIEHKDYKASAAKGMGLSLFAIKNYQDATPYLEEALMHDPENKELAYKLDWSILRSEPLHVSRDYFERVLKNHPLRASPYMALGWVHYNWKNPDLAVEYFLKAISLDPEFALTPEFLELLEKERFGWQVYNTLGWTYYQKQLYGRARKMFERSLRIQPNKSEARKGMGYVYFQLGQYGPAITMLKQCLALNPDPNPVFELVTGANAIAPFKMQTTARTKLGRLYFIEGNTLEAINSYNEEIRINSSQPDAYDGLGWAYLKQGRNLEARSAFTTAIRLEPLNNSAHKGLKKSKQSLTEKVLNAKTASPYFFYQSSPK